MSDEHPLHASNPVRVFPRFDIFLKNDSHT